MNRTTPFPWFSLGRFLMCGLLCGLLFGAPWSPLCGSALAVDPQTVTLTADTTTDSTIVIETDTTMNGKGYAASIILPRDRTAGADFI